MYIQYIPSASPTIDNNNINNIMSIPHKLNGHPRQVSFDQRQDLHISCFILSVSTIPVIFLSMALNSFTASSLSTASLFFISY
jgi:hypothetical protein